MAIDFPKLLKRLREQGKISAKRHAFYLEDEDELTDKIQCDAKTVFTLGWDGNAPGCSGACWINKWKGLYFATSSDYEPEGPFNSLEEALDLGWFNYPTSNPEVSSDVLSHRRLLQIAHGVVSEEGDEVFVDWKRYRLKNEELLTEEEYEESCRPSMLDHFLEGADTSVTHLDTPKPLWQQDSNENVGSKAVQAYLDAHHGEFAAGHLATDAPYRGPASKVFREIRNNPDPGSFHGFKARGGGLWRPRRDQIVNLVTADLLAAGEHLNGQLRKSSSGGFPGGICAETGDIWLDLLDGGVGVEVHLAEHERTNRVQGWQLTTIRGSLVYRVLTEFLGFDWIDRKLTGEKQRPSREQIRSLIAKLQAERRKEKERE